MSDGQQRVYFVLSALDNLCKCNKKCAKKLRWLLSKQIWSSSDRSSLMKHLSQLFLDAECTKDICKTFRSLILDIVERCRRNVLQDGDTFVKIKFAVALSIGLPQIPDLGKIAVEYLNTVKPFSSIPVSDEGPQKKKKKKDMVSDVDQCRAMWIFVSELEDDIGSSITLGHLLPYLNHSTSQVRWLAAQAISELLKMSSYQKDIFLRKYFTEDEKREWSIGSCVSSRIIRSECIDEITTETSETELTHTKQGVVHGDLSDTVVEVAGILLPRMPTETNLPVDDLLVPVTSMMNNLRCLALAVASGSPVLLQGPVGSGKTTLVEHLAHLTGRCTSKQLLKIQLGDQTDSKALLGTYRCTEVPGEFIWQPGILTRAVTEGLWVLLEDMDLAPMDVISVLLPLLETNSLSVPGHGESVKAHPGFRMFATQRLVGGIGGWYHQRSGSCLPLEKMWTTINVEPLSSDELKQVIVTRFPQLSTVVDKLLDIYLMLSAGGHGVDEESSSMGRFLSHAGRLVSTRDLMTWVSRISGDFDVSSTDAGQKVFQEALDCFVTCLPSLNKRIPLAEAIGAKLNVSKLKAEFYLCKYKPDIQLSDSCFKTGRAVMTRKQADVFTQARIVQPNFAYTRQSVALLEKVGVCVNRNEPVLLVGETGTGKTSSVQFFAHQLGHKLHVINLNQQSDSTDLLGGFKPVDLKFLFMPIREDFELLFLNSFSRKQNTKFLGHVQECFSRRRWQDLLTLMEHTQKTAVKKFKPDEQEPWKKIGVRLHQLKIQVQQIENALAFTFFEGTLVKALRCGNWVLLDEINLAAAETLECLSGLLESASGSVVLTERGDIEPVVRHPDFRLFACMNPATDVGKKDLTLGIRNRFTEMFVDELEDPQDLKILVNDYLKGLSLSSTQVDGIIAFYLTIRKEASKKLNDGTGHKPHYSLRTLCRALKYVSSNPCGLVARSLYEGFCLSFLTQLDRTSHPVVQKLVCQYVLGKTNIKSILTQPLPQPASGKYLSFEGYWISQGSLEPHVPENYILTPSVRENLKDLSRVISSGQHPVLIQGETSVGKTSLITWLAQASGNRCMRVNNHEHTDLQEYVGCYAADDSGKLVFKEGVLVEAMRKGHWIILDELNLASTDVLEALNRLLDDNRELFIPETQETVRAHPKFMLFATQNPPGLYGGRKVLSRAFRNRFVELHFGEIPSKELETILHQRCNIPLSYARRLVNVMLDLQTRRRGSGVFAGKQGFMTLRDLFRWAERYSCTDTQVPGKFYDWDQHLADHGYMLLAGRVRKQEETEVIQEVLKKHLKRDVHSSMLFDLTNKTSSTTAGLLKQVVDQSVEGFQHIVWTHNMRRLAVLIGQAMTFKEPILLVGDTGCGKTTMCQLYSTLKQLQLYSVNCHLHTESADFLGGLRPVRSHGEEGDPKDNKLFEWLDGPLVNAMKEGSMFLIDEISLADDSVLERLNSVLEPEQTLLLAEKGGGDGGQNQIETVKAASGFQVLATMNPGGDFGKKELSPALRNRFTEIWCPQTSARSDLEDIIEHNIADGIHLGNQQDGTSGFGAAILDFIVWFSNNDIGKKCTVSIRDILTWVHFINTCGRRDDGDISMDTSAPCLDPPVAYVHGACLVFLDALGAGNTRSEFDMEAARSTCIKFLLDQVNSMNCSHDYMLEDLLLSCQENSGDSLKINLSEDHFSIPPFSVLRGDADIKSASKYALQAPTTCLNAQRILRALQLPRPLLLEGSPGVGKTSLVTALARSAGRELVRINLSEQTDISDLFGADLPVEGAEGGRFSWRDGPLLQALKAGHWVVLDELNLASQSVLEGLNACLDHRSEVFIPELARTFHIQHEKTRLFACQNPLSQGGGRKGLPRSFLNRFTQVYVEPLSRGDLLFIAASMYHDLPEETLSRMIDFNMEIHRLTVVQKTWGHRGGPWEFNLRDLFRWCDLLLANQMPDGFNPGEYVSLVYADRMRTITDKQKVMELCKEYFPEPVDQACYPGSKYFSVGTNTVQIGHSFLERIQPCPLSSRHAPLQILHQHLIPLESVAKCVQMNWMTILVGPQSCGKTSIVRLLSELTGNTLQVLPMNSAMDTTELLGGFEQANCFRHLEEVGRRIEKFVRQVQRTLLCHHSTSTLSNVQILDQEWSSYSNLTSEGGSGCFVEEHECLKSKVNSLQSVLTVLEKIWMQNKITKLEDELEDLKIQLNHLNEEVRIEDSKVGQGTFEWVDSLLVKAVRSGNWLLIDNVNFCSPSVLDRLNALLEPGGVLSINERGVIDGQIPTITPHTNFRLFLAMDPKFGEISRAMRNRGIEIYIPGEEDECQYSHADTKMMMSGLGLKDKASSDWLISLHMKMKERLPRTEQPVIVDLLRVTMTTVQQKERGVSMDQALYHATNDVYIRSLRTTASKEVAKEILRECLKSLERTLKDEEKVELGVYPVSVPCSSDFGRDMTAARVQREAGVLTFLEAKLLELYSRSGDADVTTVTKQIAMLCTSVELLMSRLPERNWLFASEWYEKFGKTLTNQYRHFPSVVGRQGWTVGDFVKALPRILSSCVNNLSSEPVCVQYRNLLQGLCAERPNVLSLLQEQPWHVVWNPHFLSQLLKLTNTRGHTLYRTEIATLCHKVCLAVHLSVMFRLLQPLVDSLKEAEFRLSQSSSPVGIVITHMNKLLEELEAGLSALVEGIGHVTEDTYGKMMSSLPWICRLLLILQRWQQTSAVTFMCYLSLHWNWFYSKTLLTFTSQQHLSSMSKFGAAVVQLQRVLGEDNMAAKQFERFWSSFGHTAAFVTASQFSVSQKLQELRSALSVYDDAPIGVLRRRIQALHVGGVSIQKQLLELARLIRCVDISEEEAEDKLQAVQAFLRSCNIHLTSDMDVDMEHPVVPPTSSSTDDLLPVRHVELWPLFEYMCHASQLSLLSGVSDSLESHLSHLQDYCLYYTPAEPTHLDYLKHCLEQDSRSEAHQLVCKAVLERMWVSMASKNTDVWLHWDQLSLEDETSMSDVSLGPGILQLSPISYFSYCFLSHDYIQNEAASLPVHVPLKNFDHQLDMLYLLSRQLWCHATTVSSPRKNVKYQIYNYLLASFYHLVQSVTSLLSLAQREQYTAIMDDLQMSFKQNSVSCAHIRKAHSGFQCVTESLDSETVSVMNRMFEVVQDLVQGDQESSLGQIGHGLVFVGLAQMILLSPRGPVDPVEKQAVKLEHVKDELHEVEAELEVAELQERLLTGQTVSDSPHPWIRYLMLRRETLRQKQDQLQSRAVYRPPQSQFYQLVQDVRSFMQSVGSTDHVTGLLSKLLSANQNAQTSCHGSMECFSYLQQETIWQKTIQTFLYKMKTEYRCYRDLLDTFTVAVHGVSFGMRLIAQRVDLTAHKAKFRNKAMPETIVGYMSRFPSVHVITPSMLHLSNFLSDDFSWLTVEDFIKLQDKEIKAKDMCSRLLVNALLEVRNHCLTSRELSTEMTFSLSRLLDQFLRAWQEQEAEKQQKEAEQEALYRYKERTHGDERTEDEKEDEEFRLSFPNFEKDFEDVSGPKSLESSGGTDEEGMVVSDTDPDCVKESDVLTLVESHRRIFSSLTRTSWMTGADVKLTTPRDYVMPALGRYSVGASLAKMGFRALDYTLDQQVLGGHLLVCGAVEASVSETSSGDLSSESPLVPVTSSMYNIYTDSNVAEVIQCRPILIRFLTRLSQLQQEWPDHPTLKMLEKIVERVLSFPVTCPVMKFLTGLELLLEKAQDWEANAAAHVSMAAQLADVTSIIIQWRKLELSCWNRSLDTEQERCQQKVSKWWFHIYQIVTSFLSADENTENAAESTTHDVLKSLEQFLESSSIGEFRSRLHMIYAFHCQVANMDASDKQKSILSILWNVYQFYSQFSDTVEQDISRQRGPIEKELKGFVKIARWNDMSYWALKQTTEKTHKTVHKYSKKFQEILRQPVQGLLTDKEDDSFTPVDAQPNYADKLQNYYSKAVALSSLWDRYPNVSESGGPCEGLQSRLPTLTLRVRKHWRNLVTTIPFTQLTTVLDEFTGEIIEGVHELQAEGATPGLDKAKQKSEAKLMNLRKRKALADLFKHLQSTGLSYRKGLTKTASCDQAMFVPPLDVQATLTGEDSGLPDLWEDCIKYFYRCVSRKARFGVALQTPSKELGVANIDRCRGFAEHLMQILLNEHKDLSAILENYLQLRKLMSCLKNLHSSTSTDLPPQQMTREWLDRLKQMCVQLVEGLSQFLVVLYTCPKKREGAEVYPSPYSPEELSPMSLVHQGDEVWTSTYNSVKKMLGVAESVQEKLLTIHQTCFQWNDLDTLTETVGEFGQLVPTLADISRRFRDPTCNTGSCLNDTLDFLEHQLVLVSQDFTHWTDNLSATRETRQDSELPDVDKFSDGVEGMIAAALLAVQNLVKKHNSSQDERKDEDENLSLHDGHLTRLLLDSVAVDLKHLQCSKVCEFLTSLLAVLKSASDSSKSHGRGSGHRLDQLVRCYPMMQQYTDIVEFYVAQLIGLFRTTGKLLSVLLGVFTELATKGFCIPPEFSDEIEGEGATEFEDITGGGLGEGQGSKDVSDQIETEDQLDEMKKTGDEKGDDDSNQPNIDAEDNAIEMSEDFEGKLDDAEMKEGDSDEEQPEDTEELDKQLGDVDSKDTDRLDEQMWGSDDEDEEEEQQKDESKDESGPGAGQESENQIIAKDDNEDKTEADDNQRSERDENKDGEEENRDEQKPHQLDEFDENEYDEDKIDPHHGNQDQQEEPEALDLPDDLKLDEKETGKDEEETQPADVDPDDGMVGENVEDEVPPPTEERQDDDAGLTEEEQKEEDKEEDVDKEEEGKEGGDKVLQEDPQETEDQEDEGKGTSGINPQDDEVTSELPQDEEVKQETEDPVEGADERGKTSHSTQDVEMMDTAQDEAATGENEQKEQQGQGVTTTDEQEGHEGETSTQVTDGTAPQGQKKKFHHRPGQSDEKRSLGTREERYKRLKTIDQTAEDGGEREEKRESDLYQHIQDAETQHDAQTLDVATTDQQEQQPVVGHEEEKTDALEEEEDTKLQEDTVEKGEKTELKEASKLSGKKSQEVDKDGKTEENMDTEDRQKVEIDGERVKTLGMERPPESTIHTAMEHLHLDSRMQEVDEERLRAELEENILSWSQHEIHSPEAVSAAAEAWQRYDTLTSGLAQDLCEQLRLILEPSQATKLKGDYRTGKRLNMRKVIPYIASQFRKDKIWLRRTKPSRRQYQIMLAIDDSSSMVDNHSKQLAFESLALISNALTLLESGELAVCSFGESVRVLHSFTQQFTNQSGASILQYFSFEQKKTKIAQLLHQATAMMIDARQRQRGAINRLETAQLLLIVSDGRGLFMEGMEVVQSAVRRAREANIFLVFVIIDNPQSKDSILDIQVPVFKGAGQLPEIKSYMENFPFPFYIILRDINSLPQTLSDALRQWFELVTAGDRL